MGMAYAGPNDSDEKAKIDAFKGVYEAIKNLPNTTDQECVLRAVAILLEIPFHADN